METNNTNEKDNLEKKVGMGSRVLSAAIPAATMVYEMIKPEAKEYVDKKTGNNKYSTMIDKGVGVANIIYGTAKVVNK